MCFTVIAIATILQHSTIRLGPCNCGQERFLLLSSQSLFNYQPTAETAFK